MIESVSRAISPAQRPNLTASSTRLQLSFVCGDFLFVHAGLRPLIPIQQQTEDDLLWIRDDFLLWDKEFEKIVVHGHTPVLEPDIRFNRINIDTGAFATGRLTCMTIEAAEIMPLMDVRDWLDELPDVETSHDDTIGSEGFQRVSASDNAMRDGESDAVAGYPMRSPDSVAAIHAKRLKQDVEVYDATARARLDPRRSTNAPSHPRR
jgi:serine/threonine protein phosphatase 1